jgi:hypothetical protein
MEGSAGKPQDQRNREDEQDAAQAEPGDHEARFADPSHARADELPDERRTHVAADRQLPEPYNARAGDAAKAMLVAVDRGVKLVVRPQDDKIEDRAIRPLPVGILLQPA